MEAAAAGNPNPDTELDDEQTYRQVQDELAVKKYDTKLLNILESCILFPPGVTAERMRKWDPFYIMSASQRTYEWEPTEQIGRPIS